MEINTLINWLKTVVNQAGVFFCCPHFGDNKYYLYVLLPKEQTIRHDFMVAINFIYIYNCYGWKQKIFLSKQNER